MNQSAQIVYQQFFDRIQDLWHEEFLHQLALGKYSRWAVTRLTPAQIIAMLVAIGQYGRLGLHCPDIDTESMFSGQGLDPKKGIQILLNEPQRQSLFFLVQLYSQPSTTNLNAEKLSIPIEFSEQASDFIENIDWATDLTSSDLFGVIWHVGGFATRTIGRQLKSSINEFHPRTQEALICLLRVAQKQPTYYQLAGERFPLREHDD